MNCNCNDLRKSSWLRVVFSSLVVPLLWLGAGTVTPVFPAGVRQQNFASPEQAVDALSTAVRAGETTSLLKVLGAGSRKLVNSGDAIADREGRDRFAAAYDVLHEIIKQDDDRATLVIGKDEWPFPIPLVRDGNAWRFDTRAGRQKILDRRIGRNELNTIQVCRAYVAAQREYASKDRNGDGILEYAQKFVSSAGRYDGLYWPTGADEEQSPMGLLVATARAEGYNVPETRGRRNPYHGYYYKILKQQGKNAPGGARDYVARGHMIGGFALVAFPAQYRASGVMTFIVNQEGVVYQKDLGPDTAAVARRMTLFNPDAAWKTP